MTNKIDEDKKQKFNFWIYIGFIILAILFAIVIIGSLYYIFSNKTSYQSPIQPSNQISTQSSYQTSPTDNRTSYISSLFKKGGRKIFKRF